MSNTDHPLVNDIYKLVTEGKEISKEAADRFGKDLADLIVQRLQPAAEGGRTFTLRTTMVRQEVRT